MKYSLKRIKNLKSLRIIVRSDASVEVRAPLRLSLLQINDFINRKTVWIKKKLHHFSTEVKSLDTTEFLYPSYENCKNRAKKLVMKELIVLNSFYNYSYNRVIVRNQKSKWGSCSSKKNLNFNYRILFLPERLAKYLIVHELCHLKELNHSKNFWNLVGLMIPDYRELEKELKRIKL
jgi:hypothetical protein